jgi:hypothetical protein
MNAFKDLVSETYAAREFSMFCFGLMDRFHWTYEEVMELPLPVLYALREYLDKTNKK